MENMSRMEVMKYGFMESSSSCKKEAMASLKTPKRRRKKVKVTAWCGPQNWDHFSPTFWDHFTHFQIQIQKASMGANLPCCYWTSLRLAFNGLTLSCLSNHTRPNLTQPWPHTRPFTFSPKHFILGRFLLPEASSNKKKMEHTSKVIASITLKGANHLTAKHAEEGSGQVPCKKEASRFEEDQMALERKGLKLEQKGHTKKKWWILNPHLKRSKIR